MRAQWPVPSWTLHPTINSAQVGGGSGRRVLTPVSPSPGVEEKQTLNSTSSRSLGEWNNSLAQARPGRKTGCSPSRNTKKSEFPGPRHWPVQTPGCSCAGARCSDPSGLLSPLLTSQYFAQKTRTKVTIAELLARYGQCCSLPTTLIKPNPSLLTAAQFHPPVLQNVLIQKSIRHYWAHQLPTIELTLMMKHISFTRDSNY